jgi:branched-chain amino acid transport system substrate-binding protein
MRHYQAIKGRSKFMAYVSLLFVTIAFSFGTFGLLEKEALAADPIIIGCPLAMGFPQGVGAKQGFDLAVMEINKQGGVKVGNERRPIKIVVMDTRDLAAGVPVSE